MALGRSRSKNGHAGDGRGEGVGLKVDSQELIRPTHTNGMVPVVDHTTKKKKKTIGGFGEGVGVGVRN